MLTAPDKHIVLQTNRLDIGYQKKKEQKLVAAEIDIDLAAGELVAVIGVNGVGKSTFLRTISGLQSPLGGAIFIGSEDRKNLSPQRLAGLISLVLTEQPLSKNLTVAELVALGRQPYTNWIGNLRQEDKQHVEKSLELVNLEDLRSRRCYELSDGQLQKVLIARAVAQDTPIMILDEPTSHLDMYHKAQVLKLLKQLSLKTRKAVIFATHEINLALQLCDRIILMKPDVVMQDSPQNLIEKGAFRDMFPSDLIFFDEIAQTFRIKT